MQQWLQHWMFPGYVPPCLVIQGTVWVLGTILVSRCRKLRTCIVERRDPVFVQTLLTELPVECFDERVV